DNLIDKMLVLFGHTRTEPTQYYYRTAQFLNSGRAVWHNWQPVNISINSTRVFPVYAFGRILVFWTEIEAYEESVPFVRSRPAQAGSTSKVEETDTVLKHRAAIKYSFHNFNQQWINPQTLKQGIELEYRVDAAYIDKATQTLRVFSGEYCLTSTPQNPQGDIRKISEVYPGLPTEFQHGIDAAVQTADRVIFFRDDQCAIKDDTADWKGESIATMFTSDLKLEEHPLFGTLGWSYYVVPNEQDKPYQQGIAATFTVEDKICLIDHQGLPRFFKYDSKSEGYQEENITDLETVTNGVIHKRPNSLIKEFIKILTHNFLRLEPVDAVFEDETGIVYVLRKGQYECYRHNDDDAFSKLEKLDGFPKPIKGNLSFNLDKFFNKLHVVATADTPADAVAETAQTFVSLTYNSPKKDTALLTGKVFDDFTFEAGEIRTDPLKYKLLRILPGTFRLPSPANSPAVISQFFVTLTAKINRALAEVKRLEALEQALPNIERVLDDIRQIITDQEAQSEGRIAVSSDFQETFNRLMDGDGGIIAVVDNGRGTVAQALKTAFITFVNSDRDDGWQTAFSQLTNASRQLEVTVERVQDALPARLAALQATITPDDITQSQTYLKNYRHDQAMLNRRHREIAAVLDYAERLLPTSTAPQGPATRALNAFETSLATAETSASHWVSTAQAVPGQQTARELRLQLRNAKQALTPFQETLTTLNNTAQRARENLNPSLTTVQSRAYNLRERYFGNFDSFPIEFGITDNQTNFTFGEPDWHIFEAKQGTFLCRPRVGNTVDEADEIGEINPLLTYDIIRLTTTTIPKLSRNLFSGGIDSLLTLASQLEDEQPSFQLDSPPDNPDSPIDSNGQSGSGQRANSDQVIRYSHSRINSVPNSTTLDYKSANANYYWEIFFHAPSLIAQALNHAQKFEEAKRWYEYIFDPTFLADADIAENLQAESIQDAHWRFLPFARVDASLETHLEDHLHRRLDIADLDAEIYAYLNDPFDFHAIARIRETAYQKAIMMAYIDNLLDWGDMLFGQHTIESINEARMLYILAYDLLGNKPLALGNEILPEVRSYENLLNPDPRETDFLLDTGSVVEPNGAAEITEATEVTELAIATGTVHQTVESPYFFIPDNSQFLDYWNRVEDKLYKIRHNLNIDGVKQALPLFQPSIDPLTVARSIAAGGNLSQIMASTNVTVPHYRFNFMFYKAKELVHRLSQFGGDLLAAIEKQDAEQLSLMQHKQEAVILSLLTNIKKAQIAEAKTSIRSLEASLAMVEANEKYNQDTYETGLIPAEIAQLTLMSAAIVAHAVSAISRTVASFGGAAPDSLIGPFIAGIKIGGEQAYAAASSVAEVSESIGEGLSVGGEIAGIVGQYQRMMDDVKHQVDTAIHDKTQIKAQIEGAELQLKIAEYELAIHEKEIAHHQSISTFMTRKFSNQQLYQWMSGQLSELYYQTYKIAYDMAKAAEKAFQFERGLKESEVNYISGMYWNSQRKGLLAGDSLGLDLERMEQAFIQGDRRRFEISKSISLLELAPLAFLYLKAKGFCEFELSEALFDYDFPGHYCRQIKTLEVSFDAAEGETVNATLTQLNHKTVLEADPKAVKYLLDPKDTPPLTIRSDWRANQQIVLSLVDDYEKGHGLFERRYEDDRYLPFEGTGAVSRWRLELNGKRGAVNLAELLDVTITIKYTALPGGEPFTDAVKGLLKPYDTVRY
ncbi:MAG: neuraminidase-like domain-containing protein, partial [Cyanobacteria bacterium P01_G01_bin.38]